MLKVSGNFVFVGNIDVGEDSNEARAEVIDHETSVKAEEEVEYVIKIEFNDVENETLQSELETIDVSKNKTNCNQDKKKAKQDSSGQGDNYDQNLVVTGTGGKLVINRLSRRKQSNKNERHGSTRLSRKKFNVNNNGQFDDKIRNPVNDKIKKIGRKS